jgi:hypothetical protein
LPRCARDLRIVTLPAHPLAPHELAVLLCPAQDAKSDLVNVLSSLEAHWHVLEAEVVEINRDIDYCEQCLRKYGEWFNSPLQYLRELKRTKKNKMCAPSAALSALLLLLPLLLLLLWAPPCGALLSRADRGRTFAHLCLQSHRRKEIIRTMESFNNNLQGGKKLVKSLEKQMPVSVLQAPSTPAVIAATAHGDDGPELLVGSAVSGGRVIKPVES